MACKSSTLWEGVGGEGPNRADSMVDRSCFGETMAKIGTVTALTTAYAKP